MTRLLAHFLRRVEKQQNNEMQAEPVIYPAAAERSTLERAVCVSYTHDPSGAELTYSDVTQALCFGK